MHNHTDWKKTAILVGALKESDNDGSNFERGGTEYAKLALEQILGDEWIENTVNYFIDGVQVQNWL